MAAGERLAREGRHADRIAQRVLMVDRRLLDHVQCMVRQPQVAVGDELAWHVGNGKVLLMILDGLAHRIGAPPQLDGHADAVAREGLAHRIARIQRRAQQVLVAAERDLVLAHVLVQHALVEDEVGGARLPAGALARGGAHVVVADLIGPRPRRRRAPTIGRRASLELSIMMSALLRAPAPLSRCTRAGALKSGGGSTRSGWLTRGMREGDVGASW